MDDLEKKEQYVNVVVKNEQQEEEEIRISFGGIFANLKRFFAAWLIITIIVSIVVPIGFTFKQKKNYQAMQALVQFSYDGVEEGLAPDGSTFYADSMKNPQIIAAALEKLGMSAEVLERVRMGITIRSLTPQSDAERVAAYKKLFEGGGSTAFSAAEMILERTSYPTQYVIVFDYAATGLDALTAEKVLNKILDCYGEYFLKTYGFNEPLGNAIKATDYSEYDYAEVVDLFASTLDTLNSYVRRLAQSDSTGFRSAETGYTFSDLSNTISMLKSIDLDMISSYIVLNTVTKDRDSLITHYQYTVEQLEREKIVEEELLTAIANAIEKYEKNTVMLLAGTDKESANLTATGSSEQYDSLFTQQLTTREKLSQTMQKIENYNRRLERLKDYSKTNTIAMRTKVEEDIQKLNEKIHQLIEMVNVTAEEYYKTVVFAKAFDVLVPANATVGNIVVASVKDAVKPVILLDALIFVIYLGCSVVLSCIEEYKKAHMEETPAYEDAKGQTKEGSEKRRNG